MRKGDEVGAVARAGAAIDWGELRAAAVAVAARAYVPYSHYPVGAAAVVDDGRLVVGCNVENASYGLALCAECALVSQLHVTGGGRLVAFVCVNGGGEVIMPCGRCRQLLYEHAATGMVCETVSGVRTIDQVIPDAFGPRDLDEFAARAEDQRADGVLSPAVAGMAATRAARQTQTTERDA